MICQFILRTASSFPYAIIQPVELFDRSGAEFVDGCSFTLQLFHQVEGAVLVRVEDHLVHHKLLFRRQIGEQALNPADTVDDQLQGGQEMVTNVPRYSQKSIPKTA